MPLNYEPLRKNRWLLRFPADLGIQEWWCQIDWSATGSMLKVSWSMKTMWSFVLSKQMIFPKGSHANTM